MATFSLRPAVAADLDFLRSMLYEAAFWRESARPPERGRALQAPDLARYVDGWGRPGDRGLLARVDRAPVGAVWVRRFTADDHGYGYVDEETPELSIAVDREHRGTGIGRCLLAGMLTQAHLDGIRRVSLSVEADNPARRLYERFGFGVVATVDASVTMLRTVS